jgi:hypothetical protein
MGVVVRDSLPGRGTVVAPNIEASHGGISLQDLGPCFLQQSVDRSPFRRIEVKKVGHMTPGDHKRVQIRDWIMVPDGERSAVRRDKVSWRRLAEHAVGLTDNQTRAKRSKVGCVPNALTSVALPA